MKKSTHILFTILLQFFALLIFVYGFFPPPIALNANDEDATQTDKANQTLYEHKVDRLIFMVLDAFAFDFLAHLDYSNDMPFVRRSIEEGKARWFRTHTQAPSVTLPRIKALTAGIVPNYLDMFYNFAQPQFNEGNWLLGAKQVGFRISVYGDDTWVKMFGEETFERQHKTGSFFISDYDKVDQRVTVFLRRDFSEDRRKEWDILIVHYLGLDHMGHKLGGKSPEIHRKLREMNDIAEEVWRNVASMEQENERTLFCLLGDHGMAEGGSHGGSSDRETYVPTVLWSSNLPFLNTTVDPTDIEQVDMAPTLSLLLGVDIPERNIGVLIDDLLFKDTELIAKNMERNAKQMYRVAQANRGIFGQEELDAIKQCTNISALPTVNHKSISKCRKVLKSTQQKFLSTNDNFKYLFVLTGLFVSFGSTLFLIYRTLFRQQWSLAYLILFQPLCQFSVGYLQEENDVSFNFFTGALILFNLREIWRDRTDYLSMLRYWVPVLLAHVFLRWLARDEHHRWMIVENELLNRVFPVSGDTRTYICYTVFILLTAFCYPFRLMRSTESRFKNAVFVLAAIVVLAAKTSYLSPSFPTHFLIACVYLYCGWRFGFIVWLLFILSYKNYLIALISQIIGYQLGRVKSNGDFWSTCLWYLGVICTFFYTGNSNSLETFDLAAAYTGLSDYQPLIVVAQLVLNFYAGPISFLIGWQLGREKSEIRCFARELLTLRSIYLLIALLNLFIQRQHPYVWIVFSTKLLIESIHFGVAFLWLFVEHLMLVYGRKRERTLDYNKLYVK